jgi:hypothetical protein
MKRCSKCGERKPLDAFGVRRRSPSGRKSWCRGCESARQQERYRERQSLGVGSDCGRNAVAASHTLCAGCRERRATGRTSRRLSGKCITCGGVALGDRSRCDACIGRERLRHLALRRGITGSEYAVMLACQSERCAICRRQCGTGRRLAVDHDHATGRVRGLLCFRCNTALARYEEYSAEFAHYIAGVTMGPDPVV